MSSLSGSHQEGDLEPFELEQTFPEIGHRILQLNVRKIILDESYGDGAILVAIEDVTERRSVERERDELLRQKDMLLAEMQHRISNSLQIIASILLMKARSVSSEETRAHLHDAHSRVLAVAAVQQHLHATAGGEAIQLNSYLVRLCASLAGAMIPEGENAVDLKVDVTSGTATSAVSVSLGLIVTELVINALKHAFPIVKPGNAIVVSYVAAGTDWTLIVSDNGVGKGADGHTTAGGLGSSIVAALAEQLGAVATTTSDPNGTRVSISQSDERRAA